MFVTNEDLLAMAAATPELETVVVPAKTGLYMARLVRAVRSEAKDVADAMDKLVRKYGEDHGHGIFTLTPPSVAGDKPVSEHWDEFVQERGELLAAESDLDQKAVILPDSTVIPIALLVVFDRFLTVAGTDS